ncbi:MAG: DUF3035 domain-containing protein [Alphaproteobacteria bacterium]
MNKTVVLLCAASVVAALSGCEQARQSLGMDKQAPDEFAVVTRAPLSLPPDYGLRPPVPGEKRPQEATVRDQARRTLLGGAATADSKAAQSGQLSKGESAILRRAGAVTVDPAIRGQVNVESAALAVPNEGFMDKIIFWQKPPPPGVVVDAGKEARRLREASALGTSPSGDVPIIKRKKKGILEGIF